ncbi:MAG: hypothetical protein IJY14_04240 [Acholeplasmatales bacterium]|nr:hypothetical protein [Acholeplasmatales bacterium]
MEKNIKNLKKELNQRKNKKEIVYDVVGVELKVRRLSLCKTLSAIAEKICSSSYLCKIEKNQITPNRYYLKEICNRLDMTQDKIDTLLNLKMTLAKVIRAYLTGNYSFIKKSYDEGNGLKNYRYKIIELIYYISIKDFYNANKIFMELMLLISNMTDFDLAVFGLFSGILSFYNQDFIDSIKTLRAVNNSFGIIDFDILKIKYTFYSFKCLNSPECISEYNKLKLYLLNNGYYELLEEANYVMALYLLKNKYFYNYSDIFKSIKSDKYRYTLIYLSRYMLAPKLDRSKLVTKANDFCSYLELLHTDRLKGCEVIERMNTSLFDIDFNLLILQYLAQNDDKRIEFIEKIALPILERTSDQFMIDLFLDELNRISTSKAKYKIFSQSYRLLKNKLYG